LRFAIGGCCLFLDLTLRPIGRGRKRKKGGFAQRRKGGALAAKPLLSSSPRMARRRIMEIACGKERHLCASASLREPFLFVIPDLIRDDGMPATKKPPSEDGGFLILPLRDED
jgi:hypothetical protein